MDPFVLEFLRTIEVFKSKAYLDAAGKLTIGYGHVITPDERFDMAITEGQGEALLTTDVLKAQAALARILAGLKDVRPHEFSALSSFVFNLGPGALGGSTLLTLYKVGDRMAAAQQFRRWCYAKDPKTEEKKLLPGLRKRRIAEELWFLGGAKESVLTVLRGGHPTW